MKFTRITLKKDDGPITDFARERNLLLKETKTEWVLFVDSDEEVSSDLKKEIQENLENPENRGYQGYLIPRKDFFWGKWLRFGETGNMKLLRLGKKNAGQWRRKVHEYWDIKNPGELKSPLLHYPHKTISDFIRSINTYSDIDAREFNYFNYAEVFYKPVGKFIQNYFFRLGFLDGFAGFVHAFVMSWQSLVVRVKQYENDLSTSAQGHVELVET